jgi:hypothetical protein
MAKKAVRLSDSRQPCNHVEDLESTELQEIAVAVIRAGLA